MKRKGKRIRVLEKREEYRQAANLGYKVQMLLEDNVIIKNHLNILYGISGLKVSNDIKDNISSKLKVIYGEEPEAVHLDEYHDNDD